MNQARFWLGAALALLAGCHSTLPGEHYDVLIFGDQVFDGTTQPPAAKAIGIRNGRIATLEAAQNDTADHTVDARGLIVVPGFIDPHTHALSDLLNAQTAANENYLRQGVTTVFIGNDGYGVANRGVAFKRMEATGIGSNVAFFAGHGGIRKQVMGLLDRPPTAAELTRMTDLVRDAMQDGAVGLSSGLYYAPGSYADRDEVVALARVAAQFGGVYDTHMRDEGTYSIGLAAALRESIDIARAAGLPLHVSHIKALGRDVWGQSTQIIEQIEQAQTAGVVITANQYPWQASGTRFSNALIPRWAMADSKAALHARLRDPQLRPRLLAAMIENMARRGGPEAMLVTDARSDYAGKTLQEVAEVMKRSPNDAAIELVINGDPSIASFVMNPDDILALAVKPWVMTGSDGSRGHPRKYATYPKAYQDLVVQAPHMTMAQFVHRSSGQVADTFGLCDRGYLRVGARADVVVIQPEQFVPKATYRAPVLLAEGVSHMIVNGLPVITQGNLINKRAGQIVRHQKAACQRD